MRVGRTVIAAWIAIAVASFAGHAHADDLTISDAIDTAAPRAGAPAIETSLDAPPAVMVSTPVASPATSHAGLAIASRHRASALGTIGLLLCALVALDRRGRNLRFRRADDHR